MILLGLTSGGGLASWRYQRSTVQERDLRSLVRSLRRRPLFSSPRSDLRGAQRLCPIDAGSIGDSFRWKFLEMMRSEDYRIGIVNLSTSEDQAGFVSASAVRSVDYRGRREVRPGRPSDART